MVSMQVFMVPDCHVVLFSQDGQGRGTTTMSISANGTIFFSTFFSLLYSSHRQQIWHGTIIDYVCQLLIFFSFFLFVGILLSVINKRMIGGFARNSDVE